MPVRQKALIYLMHTMVWPLMTTAIATFVIVGLLGGCGKKPTTESFPISQIWFIESWDNSVLTVKHDGNMYKARCDTSRSFNNAASITDEKNVVDFSTCDLAIGLVGHAVQPLDGKQRDDDGRIVVMWPVSVAVPPSSIVGVTDRFSNAGPDTRVRVTLLVV